MTCFFITGSSRGVGKALVKLMVADENAHVFGFARSKSDIVHERYQHFQFDLTNVAAINEKFTPILNRCSHADKVILINNAGALGEVKYLGYQNGENIPNLFNLNLIAPAILTNLFLNFFHKNTNIAGIIVNISSGAAKKTIDGWSGYCASKAGLNLFSEVAAKEIAIRGESVKVFSIAPGVIDTKMQSEIRLSEKSNFSEVEKFIELKKNGYLWTPKQSAVKIMRVITNPEKYQEVLLDVRDI